MTLEEIHEIIEPVKKHKIPLKKIKQKPLNILEIFKDE